ncbi:hypothetical protein CK203_100236 [Vitis vinifera]|uniref:Uncharacterized protein n=1 Tax=Vitis vinifera TaxID=29760 RepID=A0A438FIE3_VITVI|nr:hypothetical protein CK203_100236 [Vitis vinifera]
MIENFLSQVHYIPPNGITLSSHPMPVVDEIYLAHSYLTFQSSKETEEIWNFWNIILWTPEYCILSYNVSLGMVSKLGTRAQCLVHRDKGSQLRCDAYCLAQRHNALCVEMRSHGCNAMTRCCTKKRA